MYPFPEMREFFPPLTPGSVFIVSSADPHLAHAMIRQIGQSVQLWPELPFVPLRRESQSWDNYFAAARRTALRLDTIVFLPVSPECPDRPECPRAVVKHGDAGLIDLTLLWNGYQHSAPASYRLSNVTGALIPAHDTEIAFPNLFDGLFLIEPCSVVEEAKPRLLDLLESQPDVLREKLQLGEGDITLARIECTNIESSEHHVMSSLMLLLDISGIPTDRTITATGTPGGQGGFTSFHLELS